MGLFDSPTVKNILKDVGIFGAGAIFGNIMAKRSLKKKNENKEIPSITSTQSSSQPIETGRNPDKSQTTYNIYKKLLEDLKNRKISSSSLTLTINTARDSLLFAQAIHAYIQGDQVMSVDKKESLLEILDEQFLNNSKLNNDKSVRANPIKDNEYKKEHRLLRSFIPNLVIKN